MPSQGGYHRQSEPEIITDDAIVSMPNSSQRGQQVVNTSSNSSGGIANTAAVVAVSASSDINPNSSSSQQSAGPNATTRSRGGDGDADSLLEVVSARTNSRVPLLLGWAQLLLGLIGCLIGLSDAGYRSGNSGAGGADGGGGGGGGGGIRENNASAITGGGGGGGAIVIVFQEPRPARPFDVTAAFGFPLWCSISMIVSSILALWYSKTSLQRLLHLYRLYSLLNLGLLCLGLVLLVLSWVSQSQPGSGRPDSRNWPIRLLQALNAVSLITSWLLVLACVLCDFCVGKNLLQVLGIFVRTVCRKSQRDSFSELKRSSNSLNHPYSGAFGKRGTGSGNRPLLKMMTIDSNNSGEVGGSDDCQSDDDILGDASFSIR